MIKCSQKFNEAGNYYYGASSRRAWVQASRRRRGALARPSPAFWRGYYDPKVSVWLSVDPWAAKYPHVTPYNFVENNQIMLVDPTGLGPDCPDCPEGSIEPVTVTAEKLPPPGPVKEGKNRSFGPPAPPTGNASHSGTGATSQGETGAGNSPSNGSNWWDWFIDESSGRRREAIWLENWIDQVFSQEEVKNIGGAIAGPEAAFKDGRGNNTLFGFERDAWKSEGSGGDETNAGAMGPSAPPSPNPLVSQDPNKDTSVYLNWVVKGRFGGKAYTNKDTVLPLEEYKRLINKYGGRAINE